jgi:NADPH-dependent 2,4-dienoyl-CoA reductase/sulfur reductase-like enzyme
VTRVLVVGAGPAGLAAAVAALDAGARVWLVDSSDETGGQYWRHLPAQRSGEREERLHHGFARYRALRDRVVADAACTVLLSSSVWSIERSPSSPSGLAVNVATGRIDATRARMTTLEPEAIVLATGAHDRTLPFPGWDLPGVYTGGAAQALAKGERVRIGDRIVVGVQPGDGHGLHAVGAVRRDDGGSRPIGDATADEGRHVAGELPHLRACSEEPPRAG